MPESRPTPGSAAGATPATPADLDQPGEDRSGPRTASTGELIGRASEQVAELVRTEMELARAELQQTVKHAATGAGLFGTAGVLALYGGGALIATVILALALVLDAWLAALIVTVLLFAAAGIAALVGKKQVEKAPEPIQRSVANVKSDVETVKQRGNR